MVMSGRSINLATLFLGRLRPPKRLTSTCGTSCYLATPAEFSMTMVRGFNQNSTWPRASQILLSCLQMQKIR